MAPLIPVSGPVVMWVNAALSGEASIDDAVDEILGAGAEGPIATTDGPEGWALVIGRLRSGGTRSLRLLLSAPGDLSDLPGPPAANSIAVSAGQCALSTSGSGVLLAPTSGQWILSPAAASRPVPGSLGEATRALAQATVEGAEHLERLGLARGRDWAEARLAAADIELGALVVPDSTPGRAISLIERAIRLTAALQSAVATDGAAVTAGEAEERRQTLAPLSRAARRALEAGFSARP